MVDLADFKQSISKMSAEEIEELQKDLRRRQTAKNPPKGGRRKTSKKSDAAELEEMLGGPIE